jgi:hypothetical protein
MYKAAINVRNYWIDPTKNGPTRIIFVPESTINGPTKIFLAYLNNAGLQEQFWAQPSNKWVKFILWLKWFVTIGMSYQIMSSVAKLQERSYDVL